MNLYQHTSITAGRLSKLKRQTQAGWTLVELTVVVVIISIVFGLAFTALFTSKADSTGAAAEANAKTLNDAITRATLQGDTNPIIVGDNANDVEAAASYLIEKGYIR
jgi:prepilin-type N-terminal cleavage/methylation domain-containing protein